MTVKKIWFNSVEDINHFLSEADKCPFEMDIRCGNRTVDAKSALGVATMGICKELELCAYVPEPKTDFYSRLAFCMK